MIPDKIYTNNRGGYAKIPIFSQADANIEYIRKHALIEWAKNKIVKNEEGGGFVSGLINLAYQDVINKLNSM